MMRQKANQLSNKQLVINSIKKYPGLRFFELKKQTGLVNGVLQHHIRKNEQNKSIKLVYDNNTPRYYPFDIDNKNSRLLQRLRQPTTSKIIKLLIKKECCTFTQMSKHIKKSPATISIYKKKLLEDNIIIGDTGECKNCTDSFAKIKYRLTDPITIKVLVEQYGKNSLHKTADNLADLFLALR